MDISKPIRQMGKQGQRRHGTVTKAPEKVQLFFFFWILLPDQGLNLEPWQCKL